MTNGFAQEDIHPQGRYWSSTGKDFTVAWQYDFTSNSSVSYDKQWVCKVRAICAF